MRLLRLAPAMSALLVSLAWQPVGADETWVRLNDPAEFYTAWLPEAPEAGDFSRDSPAGSGSVGFRVERESDGCALTETGLPAAVRWFGGEGWVYRAARRSVLKAARGEELRYEDSERTGAIGKRLDWRSDTSSGRAEFYVHADRVYVFSCWARAGSRVDMTDEFFERLILHRPAETGDAG